MFESDRSDRDTYRAITDARSAIHDYYLDKRDQIREIWKGSDSLDGNDEERREHRALRTERKRDEGALLAALIVRAELRLIRDEIRAVVRAGKFLLAVFIGAALIGAFFDLMHWLGSTV